MTAADAAALADAQARSYARAGAVAHRSWPPEQAMDAAALLDFLSSPPFGVLSTADAAGRAHAAPIAVVVSGAAFWMASVAGARLRNLRRLPYASLVVSEGGAGAHRMVLAEGEVALHEPTGELRALWQRERGDDAGWAAAFVELRPQRLFSYRSGSGG